MFVIALVSCSRQAGRVGKGGIASVDSLLQLSQDSMFINPVFSRQVLEAAEEYEMDSMSRLQLLNQWSKYYIMVGLPDSADRCNQAVLAYYDVHPVVTVRDSNLMLSILNNRAVTRSMLHQTDSALAYFLMAAPYVVSNDQGYYLPNLYINIADAYQHQSNYPMAIEYFLKTLSLVEADTTKAAEGLRFVGYVGMALSYVFGMEDYERAEQYLEEAGRLLEGRTLTEQFSYYVTSGNLYYKARRYEEALPWNQKALALSESVNSPYHIALCQANIGSLFVKLDRLDSAQAYLTASYDYFSTDRSESILRYIEAYMSTLALKCGQTGQAGQWLTLDNESVYVEPAILLEYLAA